MKEPAAVPAPAPVPDVRRGGQAADAAISAEGVVMDGATGGTRVAGVDVARGLALLGMMAAHCFDVVRDDGSPTTAALVAGGRSAATFAVLAGVSLAFLSGGRRVVRGRVRWAVSAGLVVRALLIGLVGLLLAYADVVDVILPFYALLFVVALPLLAVPPRRLVVLATALVVLGPVLLVALARRGVEFGERSDPTPVTVVTDPVGVFGQLLLTGEHPVVLYLAYVCVGLAVARQDLSSARLAAWLLAGGAALAVAARALSWVLLHPGGGLRRLVASQDAEDPYAVGELLWDSDQGASWWYLALSGPHSHTQLDMAYTLGSALAVLGASLLVTRATAVRRVLWPLAAAGAMTLTLYSAHIVVLRFAVLEDDRLLYALLVVASLVFAVLWRRRHPQGPLEGAVSAAADAARSRVARRLDGAERDTGGRGGAAPAATLAADA